MMFMLICISMDQIHTAVTAAAQPAGPCQAHLLQQLLGLLPHQVCRQTLQSTRVIMSHMPQQLLCLLLHQVPGACVSSCFASLACESGHLYYGRSMCHTHTRLQSLLYPIKHIQGPQHDDFTHNCQKSISANLCDFAISLTIAATTLLKFTPT